MTPVGHKEIHFEDVIEAHLIGDGWLAVDRAGFDIKRGLHVGELLAFIEATQPKAWASVVSRHGSEDAARERLVARLVSELDKRDTVDVLRHGIKEVNVQFALMYPRPASTLNPEAAELYAANRCGVVRQLRYEEATDNSIDLALLVNGIPVATAELKNPITGQTHEHALRQYERDRDPVNVTLGRRCMVHFAVDPDWVFFTTRLAGTKGTRWFPFNRGSEPDGSGGKGNYPDPEGGHRTAYLWRDVWQRDAWLEILQRYLHVNQEESGRSTLIFPRFHQWDAVGKLMADARENGAGNSYLVQHSAGSGKSNSIAWLAHGLSSLHGANDEPVFNKVVVITDRVVLDRQLQKTIYQFEHRHGVVERVDGTSQQLLDALQGAQARIIITTLQKFPVVLGKLQEAGESLAAGRRYAVIVDEAHSSQTGETARALKQVLGSASDIEEVDAPIEVVLDHPPRDGDGDDALESAAQATAIREQREEAAGLTDASEAIARVLAARGRQPNMSFFSFTATPKARTLELFGTPQPDGTKGPFHVYSMRQAIEERFILDVLAGYTTYDTFLRLHNAENLENVEVDKRRAAAKLARFAKLHPYALDQRAEIVVEHFRKHVADRLRGKAKAMVVTDSRLHAVRYKLAIDDYIERQGYRDLATLVAFSGEVEDPATFETFTEPGMNGFAETELPRKFAGDDYQVLIVAEKYQTGFDQPLLVALYVDKKLEGVNAVQTLSRLNRIHPGKDRTFVLDFVNDVDTIHDAFAPYYRATVAQPTDPNLLFDAADKLWKPDVLRREEVEAYAAEIYAGDGSGQHGAYYGLTDAALERWRALEEDDRERFRDAAGTYVRAYAFLSQVVTWTDVEQEKLYAFAKTLLARLDRQDGTPGADIDMSGVELTHYRMKKHEEQKIDLESGEVGPLEAFKGDGTGRAGQTPLEMLGEIVRRFNERFGTEFTEADKILRYVAAREAKQEETRDRAHANDYETFKLTFARTRLAQMWLEAQKESAEFFEAVMNADDATKEGFDEAMMLAVWQSAREAE